MRKRLITGGCMAVLAVGIFASSAAASPPERAEEPFVCTVLTLNEQAVEHAGKFNEIGEGRYTFGPGAAGSAETFNGNVPTHATNADGAGSPGGLRHSTQSECWAFCLAQGLGGRMALDNRTSDPRGVVL